MDLTYDSQFNIAYIRFRRKTANVTTIAVSDKLNVDVAPDGCIYGIELLNANEQLATPPERRSQRSTKMAAICSAAR